MAVDEAEVWYGPYIGKSTNINSNPIDVVRSNILELLQDFLQKEGKGLEDLAGFCIGSAGVDLPQNVRTFEKMIAGAGITCPVKVVNDVELVLESETKGEPGIILVSGTGSIVYGKDADQKTIRVGGWGHLVGDEGSGYWIGKEAVSRCLQSLDGRRGKTILTEMLMEACELTSIEDILDVVYNNKADKTRVADFSKLVEKAAQAGDEMATFIMEEAVQALYQMVEAARSRLHLPENFLIVLSGGTVLGSQMLQQELIQRLYNLSRQVRLVSQEPCMGAVYLAKALV
jgi:N-acetylglucosamine kinase-like BadF-type ATPase